ncbi:MAG: hypothetical protein V2I46_10565 [Bacteroides sp.]|jgi:peptidoglycan hydrolase CwlO-like protein|nr:hypothetical protein [Bacteroides sp.]
MKKLFLILMVAGFMSACGGQGNREVTESEAPVEMEAELEEALETNIELNAQIDSLENELDSLMNNL